MLEERLSEVNALSNESQARLGETSEVLKGLEDKLKTSEVNLKFNILPLSMSLKAIVYFKYSLTCDIFCTPKIRHCLHCLQVLMLIYN